MRMFVFVFIFVALTWSSPAQARTLNWTKKLLEAFLNGSMSGASVRFHKKGVKYNFPGLGLNGKGRLQALYLQGNKIKLQAYKLKVKRITFDLSSFPRVNVIVSFKRARPAIKAELRYRGKIIDWLVPDIHWLSPKLKASAMLQTKGDKLTLSHYKFRFYGSLMIKSVVGRKKISFAKVQRRLKPYICEQADKWIQGKLKQKIDQKLNTELRKLCGGKTPRHIRLSSGRLRAECR